MGKLIDNRYEIIKKIGQGGMGAVYLAKDTRLDRQVAIKRLNLVASQQDLDLFKKRFEREAKVMASFQHPNIVSVFDYGQDDEGVYLVLEYVPGGSLAQEMRKRRFTVEEAIEILLPLSEALSAIHSRNRVHRDIKPANVIFDEYGNPKLADFGVVKLLERQDGHTLTATGAAVGTPAYMAPELIGGEASPATDQYALGVVLYELVTGKKPFKGRTPMETLTMQKYEPLPDPRILEPELPIWLCRIIKAALAKDPHKRYPNIRMFANALRAGAPKKHGSTPASPAFSENKTEPVPPTVAHKPRVVPTGAVQANKEVSRVLPPSNQAVVQKQPDPTPPPQIEENKKKFRWLLWVIGLLVVGIIGVIGAYFLIRWVSTLQPEPISVPIALLTDTPEELVVETAKPTLPPTTAPTSAPADSDHVTETPTKTMLPSYTPSASPTITPELPQNTDEVAVRIVVVTGDDGTADIPHLYLSRGEGKTPYELLLDQPSDLQPYQIDEYSFLVPYSFCDFVGYSMTKPATGTDDPWDLEEIEIYMDGEMVFLDRTAGDYSPITENSYPPAGGWTGTQNYQNKCGEVSSTTQNDKLLIGSVRDNEGVPIEGINLAIIKGSERIDAYSASDGSISVELPENGVWSVQIVGTMCTSRIMNSDCELTGYFKVTTSLSVEVPQIDPFVFLYEKATTTISGTVKDSLSNPVSSMRVLAVRSDGAESYGTTDANGTFSIPASIGTWDVYAVSFNPYTRGESQEININSNSTTNDVDLIAP